MLTGEAFSLFTIVLQASCNYMDKGCIMPHVMINEAKFRIFENTNKSSIFLFEHFVDSLESSNCTELTVLS